MAISPVTLALTGTYVCLNSASAASGSVSVYPIDGDIWLQWGATTTLPTNDAGAIPLGPAGQGAAVINQTLAALWPGAASPAYLFARTKSGVGGNVAVSCA